MTLAQAAVLNRRALVAQLYDEWQGWYIVQRLRNGAYVDVRPLSREEALTYRCQQDEGLRVMWKQTRRVS